MEIVYTNHAKQRMLGRKITTEMVEETLGNPTATSSGTENKKIASKKFGEKIVEVVFVEEENKIIVISVMWG